MICLSSVPLFLKLFVRELPWYKESINDAPHARFQLVGARLLPLRLRESARTRVHPESLNLSIVESCCLLIGIKATAFVCIAPYQHF